MTENLAIIQTAPAPLGKKIVRLAWLPICVSLPTPPSSAVGLAASEMSAMLDAKEREIIRLRRQVAWFLLQ